ncbi:MAG: hypothetical protein JEZ07_17050 [Phycisphaerae bacterium]|nr:hypothetical protein [Phycisphaerae bacterium]
MTDTDNHLKEYDYQALHGLSFERGCARAFSRKQAKNIIKKHGYRWFYLWPRGETPWWAWSPFDNSVDNGKVWFPFLLKKKDEENIVIYTFSRIWPIISSLLIISLAGTFLWLLLSRTKSVVGDLVWVILTLYILLQGIFVGVLNSKIIVDKKVKEITLAKSVFNIFDLSRIYHANDIEKIVVSSENFYDSDTSNSVYLVRMCLGEIDIQLHASTAKEKIFRWAQEISSYLSVPFVNTME